MRIFRLFSSLKLLLGDDKTAGITASGMLAAQRLSPESPDGVGDLGLSCAGSSNVTRGSLPGLRV
jgi:hypothetical protein